MSGVEARIKGMTKQEKLAELMAYFDATGSRIGANEVLSDQAKLDVSDSAVEEALLTCATAAGSVLGRGPVTARELAEAMQKARQR
jgi:hypothetical protein